MGEPRALITDDGTRLLWQPFGSPSDPIVLLLGGASWTMDAWPEDLCEAIAAEGRQVVRFDARDTGGSTQWPAGAPGYTGDDLVDDALAVGRAAGMRAGTPGTLVGLSMGGGLAQTIAGRHPELVLGTVLVATSPADPTGCHLDPPTPALQRVWAEPPPEPDWSDPAAVVDHVVADERAYAGPAAWDPDAARTLARRVVARTPDVAASLVNHVLAVERDGGRDPVRNRDLVGVPTTVLHGDADPLFPGHGRALADLLGAAYVGLPGVGHQLPPRRDWPSLVAAVLSPGTPIGPVRIDPDDLSGS